jgi:hypothetical protein
MAILDRGVSSAGLNIVNIARYAMNQFPLLPSARCRTSKPNDQNYGETMMCGGIQKFQLT